MTLNEVMVGGGWWLVAHENGCSHAICAFFKRKVPKLAFWPVATPTHVFAFRLLSAVVGRWQLQLPFREMVKFLPCVFSARRPKM